MKYCNNCGSRRRTRRRAIRLLYLTGKIESMKLILASGSPRRKELLTRAGATFEVCVSDVDESGVLGTPQEVVAALSRMKAEAVFAKDEEDAMRMLGALVGRKHYVYTGVCVIYAKNGSPVYETEVVGTEVFFRDAGEDELRAYVGTGEPMGKAGAYAIQGKGGNFVEKINGDRSNVIGLPVCTVIRMLEKAGIGVR